MNWSKSKIMKTFLFAVFLCFSTLWAGKISSQQENTNHLTNPKLAISKDGKELLGWENFNPKNPYVVVTDESNTLRISGKSDGKVAFGVKQTIEYLTPSVKPINISGWSRATDIKRGAEYCIFLDILHTDGSWTYSVRAKWQPGTHGWEATEFSYRPKKPVKKIFYFILLRKNSGSAMFKDLSLTRGEPKLQIHYVSIFSLAPWKNDHYRIRYEFLKDNVISEYKLVNSNNKVLASGIKKGKKVDFTLKCPGKPIKVIVNGSDGKTSCQMERNIIRITPPAKLPNGQKTYVWVADSMTKVTPLTFPKKNQPKSIKISLAGGERESVQVLVSNVSKQPLNNLSLEISDIKDSKGNIFPGKIIWERVAYVPRAGNCNIHKESSPDGIYWLPDPLLKAKSFSVYPNSTQSLFITAFANENAKAGVYKGSIKVKGSLQEVISFEIKVHKFTLPKRFSYRTAFAIMDGYLDMQYPTKSLKEIRRMAWDIMLDHRLNPDDITRTSLPDIDDHLYARKRGMNYFTICNLVPQPKKKVLWSLVSPVSAYNNQLFDEFIRRFDPYVAQLKKHNLDKDAAFYGFDERGEEYFPVMLKLKKMLNQRYNIPLFSTSSMFRLLASNPKRLDCYGNNWYCPPTMFYKNKLAKELRKKGYQVWWYTCCGPYYPYANFASLEYPFRDGRILAWMSYFNEADGFLFWHTNNWYRGTKYLDENTTFQSEFKLFVIGGAAGDGQFLYPCKNGPVSSIRLANLRDGSEDYDYLKLLEQKKGKDFAMKIAGALVPDVCNFVTNHEEILATREKVANILSK